MKQPLLYFFLLIVGIHSQQFYGQQQYAMANIDLQNLTHQFLNQKSFRNNYLKRLDIKQLNPQFFYDYKKGFNSQEYMNRSTETISRSKIEAYQSFKDNYQYDEQTINEILKNFESINPYMLQTESSMNFMSANPFPNYLNLGQQLNSKTPRSVEQIRHQKMQDY